MARGIGGALRQVADGNIIPLAEGYITYFVRTSTKKKLHRNKRAAESSRQLFIIINPLMGLCGS